MAATEAGVFDSHDRDQLLAGTVYAAADQALAGRVDQVCAVLGISQFVVHAHGLRPLQSSWGGEATYWHAVDETAAFLKTIGRPSIVVTDLRIKSVEQTQVFPSLARVFVACLAGLLDSGASVHHYAPITEVIEIWQPGMPAYDRFGDLPTA